MGRKQKKAAAEGGRSSSEGSHASSAAGPGGKANISSEDSPRPDLAKEKQQKKLKQSTAATGGQESGKGKRKAGDRDSSEDAKKQGSKQKTKAGRGVGSSVKTSEAKGGSCSVFCCMAVLSVLVAVVAVVGYATFMTYPDESLEFIDKSDEELKKIYKTVSDVMAEKLDEMLVAMGHKTPDKTESDHRESEEDDNRWKEESKEEEDEFNEEAVARDHVTEDDDSEERVVSKHVPEADAVEEPVIRSHVSEDEEREEIVTEVHEGRNEVEEKVESEVDEAGASDGKSELELDAKEAVEEESLEKEFEESEDSVSEDTDVPVDEVSEEEVAEDDDEEAGKHWETVEEERVKRDTGSSDGDTSSSHEELKNEFPASESIRREEPIGDNEGTVETGEPVIHEQVEPVGTMNEQVIEEPEVPKQEVPEPEVVHVEAPAEPEVPRVVVPVEEVLKPEVLEVREAELGVAEERLDEAEPVVPVATDHVTETAQPEEPVIAEAPETPVAFEASDAVNRETVERSPERGDREEAVVEMKQEVVEEIQPDIPATGNVPVDVVVGTEQLHQPVPPVAEAEHQEQQPSDVIEPSVQPAETEPVAELPTQPDASHEQPQGEKFESKEVPAENVAGKSNDQKSAEEELERQLDQIDGIVNTTPKDAIELYNRILDVVPENARAVIGRANALGVVANAEQNDLVLEQSINEYLRVFSLPSVPKPLMVAAARACAEKQTLRGWGNAAAQTLLSLVAIYPDDLELYNELGQKYVINGAYEDARTTFKAILERDPNDAYARLHLGYIMKLVDKELDISLNLMKSGLKTVPVTDLKFYIELGEALSSTNRHNEALEVYQLAVDRKVLKSVWQRSWYNVDGLTSQPWWTPEQTKNLINLQVLEDFSKAIESEVLAILFNNSELFQPDSRDNIESGAMRHMKLFVNGRKVTENCDAAVKACSLLDAFSDATQCQQCEVKLSVLHPGLHVRPHCGPTNARLTAQLPIVIDPQTKIRVADQTRTYVSNKFLVFDDSFEQELWLAGEFMQCLLTVEMWHPDLSAELKNNLGPL